MHTPCLLALIILSLSASPTTAATASWRHLGGTAWELTIGTSTPADFVRGSLPNDWSGPRTSFAFRSGGQMPRDFACALGYFIPKNCTPSLPPYSPPFPECSAAGASKAYNAFSGKTFTVADPDPRDLPAFIAGHYCSYQIGYRAIVRADIAPAPAHCEASATLIELDGTTNVPPVPTSSVTLVTCDRATDVRLSLPRGGTVALSGGVDGVVSFENGKQSLYLRADPTSAVRVFASISGIIERAGVYDGSTELILEIP